MDVHVHLRHEMFRQVTDAALNPSTMVGKPTGMERVHLAHRRMPAVELRGMHVCMHA